MNLHFLSKTNFQAKDALIEACQNHLKSSINNEDGKIIQTILDSFLSNDWTFLSQQEIHFLKLHDKDKWADYLVYRWKFKNYGKMKKVPKFPLYLLVEPTSICNLKCFMCWQSDKSFSSEYKGYMNFMLFMKIIDEAQASGTKAITMASRGEPTIHPDFGSMLKYCKDKFYELKINTNAVQMNDELIRQILSSNVNNVVFSVDSYDKEGYKKIRDSNDFDIVVKNIKKFHYIRDKYYPNSITVTRVHGVKTDNNFDDKKFYLFWKDIADEVTLAKCLTRWDTYNNPKTNNIPFCSCAFDRLYIWYDGTCNPCDADYKSYLAMGNIKNQTIAEVWNGDKFENFRKIHLEGKRLTLVPCDRCEL